MDARTSQVDRSAELAAKWNDNLAGRVRRWKWLRLALAILFAAVGILVAACCRTALVWTAPCSIAAFVAYLLYLDSRDQLREVEARNWKSITPRIARTAAGNQKKAAQKS